MSLTLTDCPPETVIARHPGAAWGNYPVFHDAATIAKVERFCALKGAIEQATEAASRLRKDLLALMGDAPKAVVGTRVLQATVVPPKPDRIADPGEVIKGRAGSVQLRVA